MVLAHHSLLVFPDLADGFYEQGAPESIGWFVYSPLHTLWAGTEAVYVFFILSGLVLTLPVIRRPAFSWREYYPSRIIRLYLPVVASVAFALVLALVVARTDTPGISEWLQRHDQPITIGTTLRNATLLTGTNNLNSPLWSLRWEVWFSLLLPVYIWIAVRFSRVGWPIAAVSVVLSLIGTVVDNGPLMFLPIFMIGCVIATKLADLARLAKWVEEKRRSRVIWATVLAITLLGFSARWWLPETLSGTSTIVVLICAAVVVGLAIYSPGVRSALQLPFIQWSGLISFSLYLTHEPIIVTTAFLLPSDMAWLVPIIAVPLALVFAWLFYQFVEAPAHKLARWAARSRPSRQHAASRTAPD
ncbi:Peptidoglycan/LPS O-acetylase OafA/YrhL, contains acyltransferase and SGNH-hydrolase domains [Agreia sp. VKM Ac-1783]|nr:Peptidoglycan/LPS O-acetylase OafA/YrhL, contains acyltransferase and SGNH-hydrolase domains [Agreia sp. VKM Ac-1783]